MMVQNLVKNTLFGITNMIVGGATIYAWFNLEAGSRSVSSYIFPEQVTLTNWTQIEPNSLSIKPKIGTAQEPESILSVGQYQYLQDNLTIDANIFYVVNTRGDVNQFIKNHTSITPDTFKQNQIKKFPDIGSYYLFHNSDRAYLSSCLTPQGKAIATAQQFSHNLNRRKITPSLLGNWLIGKASIRDRRCLWIHLSLPLNSGEIKADQILEDTWVDLVQWWIPRFPQL